MSKERNVSKMHQTDFQTLDIKQMLLMRHIQYTKGIPKCPREFTSVDVPQMLSLKNFAVTCYSITR